MATQSRLDRALDQYTRTTARIDAAARSGETVDVTDMAAIRGQWETEARALGASDADLEAAGLAGIASVPRSPVPAFSVEVAEVDRHGDPGFVHYRADFHTSTPAGGFALSQAAALSAHREVDNVAVSITRHRSMGPEIDLQFIGTAGELATELASLPEFAASTRRVQFPAPEQVTAAAERVAVTTPSLPEGDLGSPDVLEVQVYSTRPSPLPNSRTDIGLFEDTDARRIAEELATELRGAVALTRGDSVLLVTHVADIAEADRQAADRFDRVRHLRANLAVLDPVLDAEHITALSNDIAELRARVPAELTAPPASLDIDRDRSVVGPTVLLDSAPGAGKTAPRADVGADSERPQRLLYSHPTQIPGYAPPQVSATLPPLPPVTPAERDHGIG